MAGRLFYNHSYTSSVNFDTHKMKSFIAVLALVAVAVADVSHLARHPEADAQVIAQEADVLPDQYQYKYETSNGISGQESGVLQNAGSDVASIAAQGANSYTAPDGTQIRLTWTADADGFHPQGDHLPTPPPPQPIPDYIVKAIEYIRTHPAPEATLVRRN